MRFLRVASISSVLRLGSCINGREAPLDRSVRRRLQSDCSNSGWSAIFFLALVLVVSCLSYRLPLLVRFENASVIVRMAAFGAPFFFNRLMRSEDAPYQYLIGAYVGANYTGPARVTLKQPKDQTDLKLENVTWRGEPFEAPIYYGARGMIRRDGGSWLGAMVDFTHIKATAERQKDVRQKGQRSGIAVPAEEPLARTFHRLEFSHGHNLLTLNGVAGHPLFQGWISPYAAIGFGVAISHVEVKRTGSNFRTFEYQVTGPVFQFLAGFEVRLFERFPFFFEYKLSIASINASLADGGSLSTNLWTHQGVSGVLFRSASQMPVVP